MGAGITVAVLGVVALIALMWPSPKPAEIGKPKSPPDPSKSETAPEGGNTLPGDDLANPDSSGGGRQLQSPLSSVAGLWFGTEAATAPGVMRGRDRFSPSGETYPKPGQVGPQGIPDTKATKQPRRLAGSEGQVVE